MHQTRLQHAIHTAPRLTIKQQASAVQILSGFEMANRYDVKGPGGGHLGEVLEFDKGGVGALVSRSFLGSHRGFRAEVVDQEGLPSMVLSRDFFWFFSTMEVRASGGMLLGTINQKFGLFVKKYELFDFNGYLFATISGPFWRPWTFKITHELTQQPSGVVSKKWGGATREIFTKADTFHLEFGQANWTPEQRSVLFAAAITIDFDHFEHKN